MEIFFPLMKILMGRTVHKMHHTIQDELKGKNKVGDWYFLKDRILILRYGYFETTFLLPKFVTL